MASASATGGGGSEDEWEEAVPVVPEGDEGLKVVPMGNGMSMYERAVDFKNWGIGQLVISRQYFAERAGYRGRTVDLKLTERVGKVRESRAAYEALVTVAIRLHDNLLAMEKTHLEMAYMLSDMSALNSQIPAPLRPMMKGTSSAHLSIIGRNTLLVCALDCFISSVTTLIKVAVDDTLAQIPHYKSVRLEYDAYRNKLEYAKTSTANSNAAVREPAIKYAEDQFRPYLQQFMAARRELLIRVRFLEQNEVSVMRKQLVLLNNAVCAFYGGKTDVMRQCLKDFHIKVPKILHDPTTSKTVASAIGANPLQFWTVGRRPGAPLADSPGGSSKQVSRACSSSSSATGDSRPESVELHPPSASATPSSE